MKHLNNGACLKCSSIVNRYDGIHQDLLNWFYMMQANHPEMHLSEAGRDEETQTLRFKEHTSRAKWGNSAHNWNCAIDIFCILDGSADLYDKNWFEEVVAPDIPEYITWYGRPDAKFYERPHFEIKNWRQLAKDGTVSLVVKKDSW